MNGEHTNALPAPIEVRALRKSFRGQKVLQGIELRVARGETLSVLGRSGTGKSVLLKLLAGLEAPDSGSIRVHGLEVPKLPRRRLSALRKRMGFLFQSGALYDSLTVAQNVAFPLERHSGLTRAEIGGRVRTLLVAVGMAEHAEKLPGEISGGMQKRVGLARALALDPDILLCDEPTAGLDPITAGEIDELLLKLQRERGMTSIVVTHDLPGARRVSDRLALMNEGRILAEGTFEDLEGSSDDFVKRFLERRN